MTKTEVKQELKSMNNDHKRDCTACRRTLKPGMSITATFTKRGKPSGFFCDDDEALAYLLQKAVDVTVGSEQDLGQCAVTPSCGCVYCDLNVCTPDKHVQRAIAMNRLLAAPYGKTAQDRYYAELQS